MKKILIFHKPVGITPLQVIEQFKQDNPEYENEKMGYAGRLDPMAEGVLLILVGEENKKRKEYEKLSKEYEFDVLFGLTTDSYDVMGRILDVRSGKLDVGLKIKDIEKSLVGVHVQPYPPFSSPKVQGKQLFKWAREGRIHEIEIPTKEIEIYTIQLLSSKILTGLQLARSSIKNISMVQGVFRQDEIINDWKEFEKKYSDTEFPVFSFRISCSSGTYVRSIAHEMGKKIGTGAIAVKINRTKVGDFEPFVPGTGLEPAYLV